MQKQSDPLDSIFNKALSGDSLFTNRQALRTDFIPENLPYRDEQITSIGQILSPILQDSKPSNLLLYGKTGSGKTVVAKYVLKKFDETTRKHSKSISVAYSNARLAGSEYRVLVDLAHSLSMEMPFTGLPISEVLQRIYNNISENNLKVIFIIDEIDYLAKHAKSSNDDMLYSLTRSSEHLKNGFISIIGISNDLHFKNFLDPRVLSSMNEEEILFPPYTVNQLSDILNKRIESAFKTKSVPSGTINLCAALAGSEHGDARRAIELLRVAGELAERSDEKSVVEKYVKDASQKIDKDRIYQAIKTLPIHEKAVLLAVDNNNDNSTTGDVYNKYQTLCKKISLDPLTQRRISGLLNELDTQGLINASIINKGRHGRTKKISSLVPNETIVKVFNDDPTANLLL
ncbi:MAG: cell division control protein Cdc6 [Thaumarchaeota archaeon]|nr:cell division control protein Cdc6 [Nitrososphaerota archaeon]|tara:strand:- start:2954 stop:4159 length:1206 start_codon:yes stop_codon:yes gene_type:complete